MGKRLNKVKAFGKKHWKGIALTAAGATGAVVALRYAPRRHPTCTTVTHTVNPKDMLGIPPSLSKYGFTDIADHGDCVEMMTDGYNVTLGDLGSFGKDLWDEIPVISPESRVGLLVSIKKTEE